MKTQQARPRAIIEQLSQERQLWHSGGTDPRLLWDTPFSSWDARGLWKEFLWPKLEMAQAPSWASLLLPAYLAAWLVRSESSWPSCGMNSPALPPLVPMPATLDFLSPETGHKWQTWEFARIKTLPSEGMECSGGQRPRQANTQTEHHVTTAHTLCPGFISCILIDMIPELEFLGHM